MKIMKVLQTGERVKKFVPGMNLELRKLSSLESYFLRNKNRKQRRERKRKKKRRKRIISDS